MAPSAVDLAASAAIGTDPLAWLAADLAALDAAHSRRQLRPARLLPGGRLELAGRELLDLCANDYLGLLLELTPPAAAPAGASGSRLITGNHPAVVELEAALAAWLGREAALVFGSGYLANLGAVSALVGRGDVVFADRLCHASLVDGIVLSRAEHCRFRHNDAGHLEDLLRRHPARRRLIVTEAVFSMDGDCAPLAALTELKTRYGALLLVDEAHSGGVCGPAGAGLAAAVGVADQVDVHVGTLSKAFGAYGGYVAGRQVLVDYLINHARSFIFSTGLPPVLAATARQALERVQEADDRRARLHANAERFRGGLRRLGLDPGRSTTQIVPLVTGTAARAVALSRALCERGVAALAIRPPTVPPHTARVRFNVLASHHAADLDAALAAVGDAVAADSLLEVRA